MDLKNADKLSEMTRGVLLSETGSYERLVVTDPPADADSRRRVEALAADGLLDPPVAAGPHRDALLAGLWLWHDLLDASHAISQGVETPTGSFWHAIMHRREGDFSNAKYWYARCRNHPAVAEIGARAARLGAELSGSGDAPVDRLTGGTWDPDAFVDLVARAHRGGNDAGRAVAVRLQKIEWAALFDHCIDAARAG